MTGTPSANAVRRLVHGNAAHAREVAAGNHHDLAPADPGHTPFAAVLACSDARVPLEQVLGQGGNDLFVVRVAGNIPGADCVGSLHYAVANLPTIEVVTVLGHSRCGAVTAAVDVLLHPQTYLAVAHDPPLRGIVDALLAGVRMASLAIEAAHGIQARTAPGFRQALIDLATIANNAITATVLDHDLKTDVVFATYDLDTGSIGTAGTTGFTPAPADDQELTDLLHRAATHLTL